MTIAELEAMARNRYNALGDTNWSTAEITAMIYQACLELTRDCGLVIERSFSSSTVASTQGYAFPSQASAIKRVTVGGRKMKEIAFREDDVLTIENAANTDTGTPQYYFVFNRTINLRPTPASVETMVVYAVCHEAALTASSTIDVPEQFHGSLVTFLVKEMAAKDLNWEMHDRYTNSWIDDKTKIRSSIRRSKRADGFVVVKTEEAMISTTLGVK